MTRSIKITQKILQFQKTDKSFENKKMEGKGGGNQVRFLLG
jgi:hypothetical protein